MNINPRAAPVSLAERIEFIDVLRGMALFGILTANMRSFFAPLDAYEHIGVLYHGRADVIAQGIVDTIFQGKFISIFSFLFGMGFAMQMDRAAARGARFLGFYPRRLLVLAVFGIIHGVLIWAGDILLTYAISGALLLLFRHQRQKILLYWAGGIFLAPVLVSLVFLVLFYTVHPHWMNPKPVDMGKLHAVIDIYAHGSLRQILVQNFVEWKQQLPFEAFAIYALALFLCGMWTWRQGVVRNLPHYRPVLRRVCAWAIPLGLLISLYVAVVQAVLPLTSTSLLKWFAQMLWLPGSHLLAAGYMAGLALIYLHADWRRYLLPFAAVGRMALTDYLMQSVLCVWVFCRFGTGLYGGVGPAWGLLATVVLYAAQVVFSNWWLGRYRFGPMEWLWRWATYGAMPPMRRAERRQAAAFG